MVGGKRVTAEVNMSAADTQGFRFSYGPTFTGDTYLQHFFCLIVVDCPLAVCTNLDKFHGISSAWPVFGLFQMLQME
jgi:hypothetical protein